MSEKRKLEEDIVPRQTESDDDSDGSEKDIVDVDFDFYNPEEIDYHAMKRLLTQLFSSDADLVGLGDIVDIIIEENHVGTTIKVDGQESDPYAILSIINLKEQKDNQGIASLCKYLVSKCPKKDEKLHSTIMNILSLEKPVGWVVSERFINMPVEVMPPMYNLLQQEIKKAADNGEPYQFEWYAFIVKVYKEVAPSVEDEDGQDEQDAPPTKKSKKDKKKAQASSETFYYQPEDEIIASYATHQFDFKFTNSDKEAAADSKRAFSDYGVIPARKLLLIPQAKFPAMVQDIDKTCSNIPHVS
ncbi:hypothetical protein DM01DRAFT_1339334 [Hesseltinella vesiculosa]|uniref:Protein BCP1 n=1 Tax=Hesseltinella vesiculosa TaxID=101127 RepID=A0A1X2G7F5_9FUNG|nr:hypothetical protein DM01DRAFT_1339334 [Hesseltinella vesiculosa]